MSDPVQAALPTLKMNVRCASLVFSARSALNEEPDRAPLSPPASPTPPMPAANVSSLTSMVDKKIAYDAMGSNSPISKNGFRAVRSAQSPKTIISSALTTLLTAYRPPISAGLIPVLFRYIGSTIAR